MASTITLGKKPTTFVPMTATFPLPGGGEGAIPVVFKYRTKSEYAKWLDDSVEKITNQQSAAGKKKLPNEALSADGKEAKDEKRFWESVIAADSKVIVAQLLDAIESWGAPFDLNQENLAQLEDEAPGVALHLLGMYGNACRHGKLGN